MPWNMATTVSRPWAESQWLQMELIKEVYIVWSFAAWTLN
jgi:hypothetical protein